MFDGLGEMYASAHNWTQTRARRKQARVENQHHFALLWSILCLFWGFVGGYNAYLLTLLESIRREVIVLSGLIEAEYKCKLKAWWKQGARKWKQARADGSRWKQLSACVRARMKASLRIDGWWAEGMRHKPSDLCSIITTLSKCCFCLDHWKHHSIVSDRYYSI